MELRGYFHQAGSEEAPKNSEYEICMAGVNSFSAVKNARIFDGSVLQVIDETKPVYVIAFSVHMNDLWKLDRHLDVKKSGNFEAKAVKSSDLGAMLSSQIEYHKPQYMKLRIGDEEFYAGDTCEIPGQKNHISFDDILDFASGEIKWKDLKGRSYLVETKMRKEKSSQELNREFAEDIAVKGRYITALEDVNRQLGESLNAANEKVSKLTFFIRKIFSTV